MPGGRCDARASESYGRFLLSLTCCTGTCIGRSEAVPSATDAGIYTLRPCMARLSEHGLRRSVGVPGLFATAYGNVGSSIYYALGLVAAHALGLTPLVFLVAGGLFALTAKTYAEGASMFPEAGGSSSFARHAFNDSTSFFAGWALSLDYILTIAISAYFGPYYASALPGLHAIGHSPGNIVAALAVLVVLVVLNIRGL